MGVVQQSVRRCLSLAALSALCAFGAARPARAQGPVFPLLHVGCPMAHCDSQMSDQVGLVGPATAVLVGQDNGAVGGGGLGCVSNGRLVACTYRGDPTLQSNLVVFDSSGHRVWEDHGQLGVNAWFSAPIIGSDGTVIAADDRWVMRVDPGSGAVLWKSAKPDSGVPVSPVPVGSDLSMVFVATNTNSAGGTAEISVWDVTTGAMLSHQPLIDPDTGRLYVTRNTVAVRGNRAYVLAAADVDPTDGRMVAIDVCNAADCGGRGTQAVRWHYDFKGPSGASPLLVGNVLFFDGRPTPTSGTFMAVADRGSTAKRLWVRSFSSPFGVSAAQDPRGGFWVHPSTASDTLLRLNADTGDTDQQVVVSDALGLVPGYVAQSVVSVSTNAAGAVVLTIGAQQLGQSSLPSYVAAIDVSTTGAGAALWTYQVAANPALNSAAGQFSIVVAPGGARRAVFNGSKSSTFFVGEP